MGKRRWLPAQGGVDRELGGECWKRGHRRDHVSDRHQVIVDDHRIVVMGLPSERSPCARGGPRRFTDSRQGRRCAPQPERCAPQPEKMCTSTREMCTSTRGIVHLNPRNCAPQPEELCTSTREASLYIIENKCLKVLLGVLNNIQLFPTYSNNNNRGPVVRCATGNSRFTAVCCCCYSLKKIHENQA